MRRIKSKWKLRRMLARHRRRQCSMPPAVDLRAATRGTSYLLGPDGEVNVITGSGEVIALDVWNRTLAELRDPALYLGAVHASMLTGGQDPRALLADLDAGHQLKAAAIVRRMLPD